MECELCKIIIVGSYGSGRFCSQKCARSFSTALKRKEINKFVSEKLKKQSKKCEIICHECKSKIELPWRKRKKKFCSEKCRIENLRTKTDLFRKMGLKSVSSRSDKKRSKNETYFSELCSLEFRTVLNQSMFNGWDADIILIDYKIAVLWNGIWHYKKVGNHNLEQVQNRDKIKLKEIEKAGYLPYVIVDMGREDKDFVKKQYQILKNFLNLTNKEGIQE